MTKRHDGWTLQAGPTDKLYCTGQPFCYQLRAVSEINSQEETGGMGFSHMSHHYLI